MTVHLKRRDRFQNLTKVIIIEVSHLIPCSVLHVTTPNLLVGWCQIAS